MMKAENTKHILTSRTTLVAVTNAIAIKYVPSFALYVSSNPEEYAAYVTLVFVILRKMTKKPVHVLRKPTKRHK